jgi:hypothetical protein
MQDQQRMPEKRPPPKRDSTELIEIRESPPLQIMLPGFVTAGLRRVKNAHRVGSHPQSGGRSFCATTGEKIIFAVFGAPVTVDSECMLQSVSTEDDRNVPYSYGSGRGGLITGP